MLVGHNLLDEPVRNRYRMHDLLRGYAGQRAHLEESDEELDLTQRRLFDYYLYVADRAERVIQPWHRRSAPLVHHKPRDIPRLAAADEANAWLAEEHTNLLTAIRHADTHGFRGHATQLPEVLGRYSTGGATGSRPSKRTKSPSAPATGSATGTDRPGP